MNVYEYYERLMKHDWSYQYSDSHTVWERGDQERQCLERIAERAEDKEAFKKLYADVKHYKLYGGPLPKIVSPT